MVKRYFFSIAAMSASALSSVARTYHELSAPRLRHSAAPVRETPSPLVDRLLGRFERREITVGVIGLGYLGLPLSLATCRAGFRVLGFNINQERVEGLSGGRSPFHHIADARIEAVRSDDCFAAASDFRRRSDTHAILICVPTPRTY